MNKTKQKPNTYTKEELSTVIKSAPLASPAQLKKVLMDYYGISYSQVKRIYNKYVKSLLNGVPQVVEPRVKVRNNIQDKTVDASVTVDKAVELDDVIRLCRIDVEKFPVKSFSVDERANGSYQWTVRCSKNIEVDKKTIDSLIETFIDSAEAHSPKSWNIKPVSNKADCLYVLNLQDVHVAKLATSRENNNADWDIKIAERVYRDAIDELMNKVPSNRVEEVLLIIGSDLLQCDNNESQTTAGTYVDSDTRLYKAFEVAAKMVSDVTEKLASRFKVRLVSFPGNHDATVSLFLSYYMSAWFRNHPNVVVDNTPLSRKYYGYGKVLLGFDHGDQAKLRDLPLVMMRENQETVSNYSHFEILSGHRHVEFSEDIKGVVIRIAPALCAPDKWHFTRSYIGTVRRSQGLLYNKVSGLEAIYYSRSLGKDN